MQDAPRTRNPKKNSRKTAATIQGRGSTDQHQISNKWNRINQMLRTNKIAVLAVQETHLDSEHVQSLHTYFANRLHIIPSIPNERASTSRGVAFVINKERLDYTKTSTIDIIPGRAIMSILNVYAPNPHNENEQFWRDILEEWNTRQLDPPDLLLGDFNIVEEKIDRRPMRPDPYGPVSALQELYNHFNMIDAWRETNPREREFTYAQETGGSLSRLDRIYMTREVARATNQWMINPPEGITTDHAMVTVSLTDKKLPTQERNPQTIWDGFKNESIIGTARKLAKVKIPKLANRIRKKKDQRHELLNRPEAEDDDTIRGEAALLLEEIKDLEARRFNRARKAVATNNWLYGEKINKSWISMAEAAAEYHDRLQRDGMRPEEDDQEERERTIEEVLNNITKQLPKNAMRHQAALG
ncbi:Endonuclease/exonuclease/phosphatase [Irpex lacteus]|nr:Endonuclease/exonuclease/phosphatase [Irpex lacteus]